MSQSESRQSRRSKHGYGERKIAQLDELKTLVWGLDLDEGIRFSANVPDHPGKSFVFITKCEDKICVTIKERILDKSLNQYVPGGKEEWKYFETPESAWQYITKLLSPPFEAYYY
ncbi:MAG: hypothetical protein PXY39_07515 [archaeon]|nr:hypothetical protein [archaeon]